MDVIAEIYKLFNRFLILCFGSYGVLMVISGSVYSGAFCFILCVISNIISFELKKRASNYFG